MNGIDISSHNSGINTAIIPGDFVIVKATQGFSYVNPDFKRAMNQALGHKLLGVYHYIGGQGAKVEMDNFIKHWGEYKENAIACLDWEGYQNSEWGNEDYLRQCIEYFIEKTGAIPFVYASLSTFPHSLCEKYGCPKWIAQYANNKETGYQAAPWNESKYYCAIRQYSSEGHLSGWAGRLDLNKAYISAETWKSYYANGKPVPVTPATPEKPSDDCITQIAQRVINGDYGNGQDRKNRIYNAIQGRVNQILKGTNVPEDCVTQIARRVINGDYGNGQDRKNRLYIAIQGRVNELLK